MERSERTLEELVRAAEDRDPIAWLELIRRFDGMIHAVARGFGLQDADAADVAGATWLLAFEQRHTLRSPERFGGWLRAIARNQCRDTCVRIDREQPAPDAGETEAEQTPGPEPLLLRREIAVAVRAAVADLPARSRCLVHQLFYGPEPDYASVAQATGMAVGSVGPTRTRALCTLRHRLMRRGFGPNTPLAEAG
jgi:RNA polymerase sigma factor (sigma-70 family)